MSRNWIIAGVAAVCLVLGIALSHLIEPGICVQKVTLAEETPALEFLPAGPGPHPVAVLAHGSETNFFLKINGAQLTFIKNDKGEVTAVIHHIVGLPDSEGKKVSGRRQTHNVQEKTFEK